MEYYKIKVQSHYKDFGRIASDANGDNILNAKFYSNKISQGEILLETPIFDYFSLESFDKKQYWEWNLFDVYKFTREWGRTHCWLISTKLQQILSTQELAKPYQFYPSKLLYRKNKLEYYIFQYTGNQFRVPLTNYINFQSTIFHNPNNNTNFYAINEKELLDKQEDICMNSGYNIINIPINRLVLKTGLDFFPMQNFLGDNLVSEKLKRSIEKVGITGFEFSELDYEVVIEEG